MIAHLYRIENLKTGEYYIGKHNGVDQKKPDGKLYWGSGYKIRRQIKKYGVNNFTYTILVISEEDYIYDLEKKIVSLDLIESDAKCLNLKVGGEGFTTPTKETREKLSKSLKKTYSNPEVRKKISDSVKKYFAENPEIVAKIAKKNKGRKVSEETRKKLSEANRGEKNGFYGKKHTPEMAEKLRKQNIGNKYSLGYKHTDLAKEKLREIRAKQVFPDGHYENVGKTLSTLIWMNDGTRSYRIRPENIQEKINDGLVEGRLMNYIDDKYREQSRQRATKQWQKIKNLGE